MSSTIRPNVTAMIPADRIHFNDDGTAWWVMDEAPHRGLNAIDRPCDTCGGSMYVWPEGSSFRSNTPCPDCDGTGRHTFTIEVENDTYLIDPSFTYRVSVVLGMVLPIYGEDDMGDRLPQEWMPHITINSFNAAQQWWRNPKCPDEWANDGITLPPAAKPGMWAVKLEVRL
jgi:hypothetical protein